MVGEQSTQVQSYYRSNIQLNDYLRRAGKQDKLPLVAPLRDVRIHFLTQPGTGGYGTSIPVGLASEFIEQGESAFVIMGDQFFLAWRRRLKRGRFCGAGGIAWIVGWAIG